MTPAQEQAVLDKLIAFTEANYGPHGSTYIRFIADHYLQDQAEQQALKEATA